MVTRGFEFSEAKPLPVEPDLCRPCAYLDPLVQCNHLCTQTVRWNGGLQQLPRGRYASAYLDLWPTDGELSFVAATARRVVRELDPELPLIELQTARTALNRSIAARRTIAFAFAAFGVIALMLALGGIYAVLSYVVGRRRQEIGIRTIFNLLGPLTNPAEASAQVLGVSRSAGRQARSSAGSQRVAMGDEAIKYNPHYTTTSSLYQRQIC